MANKMDVDPYTTVDWITNLWPGNFAGPMFYRMKAMVTQEVQLLRTGVMPAALNDETSDSITLAARDVVISGSSTAQEIRFWRYGGNARLLGFDVKMFSVVTLDMRGTFIDKLELTARSTHASRTLKNIIFGDVREIGDDCLSPLFDLKVVDFSAVTRLEKIGDGFMEYARFAGEIDLSHIKTRIEIGSRFMNGVKNLKRIRLPPHISSIGHSFLQLCEDLKEVDISQFQSMKVIPSGFLSSTHGLRGLGPAPLVFNCKKIESFFLAQTGLTTVNISFPSLTTIGGLFMSRCPNLTGADLPFSQEVTISNWFMESCEALTSLNLGTTQIWRVGVSFLRDCQCIRHLTTGKIRKHTKAFMSGCPAAIIAQVSTEDPSKATEVQCSAITQKGTQCTCKVKDSSGLCGRHKKK